jgi:hypothetical protein
MLSSRPSVILKTWASIAGRRLRSDVNIRTSLNLKLLSPSPVGAPQPADNNSHQTFSMTADQAAVIRSVTALIGHSKLVLWNQFPKFWEMFFIWMNFTTHKYRNNLLILI